MFVIAVFLLNFESNAAEVLDKWSAYTWHLVILCLIATMDLSLQPNSKHILNHMELLAWRMWLLLMPLSDTVFL